MGHTQKVAITMPQILIKEIDSLSKKQGLSRSGFITRAVTEKMKSEKRRLITECYDEVFAEGDIRREQLETAGFFDAAGDEGGQEW